VCCVCVWVCVCVCVWCVYVCVCVVCVYVCVVCVCVRVCGVWCVACVFLCVCATDTNNRLGICPPMCTTELLILWMFHVDLTSTAAPWINIVITIFSAELIPFTSILIINYSRLGCASTYMMNPQVYLVSRGQTVFCAEVRNRVDPWGKFEGLAR